MNHEPTMPDEELCSAYLDGECTAVERAWVEEQLAVSAELRSVLAEVREARAAVRSLPMRDAPPEFWARLLAGGPEALVPVDVRAGDPARVGPVGPAPVDPAVDPVPVDLGERRRRSRPSRWVAGVAAAAVAAVIAAVVLVPQPESVTPPVATFTDAHAVRSSLQDDAVSTLVPLAVHGGFRR